MSFIETKQVYLFLIYKITFLLQLREVYYQVAGKIDSLEYQT